MLLALAVRRQANCSASRTGIVVRTGLTLNHSTLIQISISAVSQLKSHSTGGGGSPIKGSRLPSSKKVTSCRDFEGIGPRLLRRDKSYEG